MKSWTHRRDLMIPEVTEIEAQVDRESRVPADLISFSFNPLQPAEEHLPNLETPPFPPPSTPKPHNNV